MPRYRECPSCRALLTDDQLAATGGLCPYCDARVAPAEEFQDPDAAPIARPRRSFEPLAVPFTIAEKLLLSLRLLFEQLPLMAALVLLIKLPSNMVIEVIAEKHANPADPFAAVWLVGLVELFFGPIYGAAIVVVMANRMAGRATSFGEAIRAGADYWIPLFAARLLAGAMIFLGLFAFLIPGIILAVRYSLIDEVVVLEGSPTVDSRNRSAALVHGRGMKIFQAGLFLRLLVLGFSVMVARAADQAGWFDDPIARGVFDSLVNVLAISFTILLFLFYWEAREEENSGSPEPFKPAVREETS